MQKDIPIFVKMKISWRQKKWFLVVAANLAQDEMRLRANAISFPPFLVVMSYSPHLPLEVVTLILCVACLIASIRFMQ